MKVADKSYFTNADKSQLAEEGSSAAAYLVVGKGSQVTPEMEEKYGIKGVEYEEPKVEPGIVKTGSETGEGLLPVKQAQKAGLVVTGEEPGAESESVKTLRGKLPEDFPGHAALEAEGITSYAKLRKAGDVTEVPGIGKATAEKIAQALAASSESEEETE